MPRTADLYQLNVFICYDGSNVGQSPLAQALADNLCEYFGADGLVWCESVEDGGEEAFAQQITCACSEQAFSILVLFLSRAAMSSPAMRHLLSRIRIWRRDGLLDEIVAIVTHPCELGGALREISTITVRDSDDAEELTDSLIAAMTLLGSSAEHGKRQIDLARTLFAGVDGLLRAERSPSPLHSATSHGGTAAYSTTGPTPDMQSSSDRMLLFNLSEAIFAHLESTLDLCQSLTHSVSLQSSPIVPPARHKPLRV